MDVVFSWRSDIGDSSPLLGGNQNAVIIEQTVLIDSPDDVTLTQDVTFLQVLGLELPQLFRVEGRDINSFGHEHRLGILCNNFEGSLDSVKNLIQNTRT